MRYSISRIVCNHIISILIGSWELPFCCPNSALTDAALKGRAEKADGGGVIKIANSVALLPDQIETSD